MFGARVRDREARAIQATPWGEWGGSAATWAGPKVDSGNAMQLLAVYGCVDLITSQVSTLPIDAFDGNGEEAAPPPWLEYPVPRVHRTSWMTQIVSSLLLNGNSYLKVQRNREGRIVELPALDPARVQVWRPRGELEYLVDGQPVGKDILHVPGLMLPGADVGVNPIEYARQTIGSGMSAEEYGAKFFGQGASLSGVIEVPGELPPDKAAEMARAWARRHSGSRNAHLPGVLEGGAAWKAMGVTNEQAQFLETRQFTAGQIAALLFRIDPSDIGIGVDGTSLTYANLEQRNTRRVQVTLMPWLIRVEAALSTLVPGRMLKFNVNGLLRADLKARYESYAIGIKSKFLVPNEARGWENLDPLPGGDEVVEVAPPAPANEGAPDGAE